MRSLDNAIAHLPAPEEIKSEANRLHEIFNETNSAKASLLKEAEEAAFVEQVLKICARLDGSVVSQDILSKALREDQVTDNHVDSHMRVDVKGELERAWALDQREILKSRGRILDKVGISYIDTRSVLHLIYIHNFLRQ